MSNNELELKPLKSAAEKWSFITIPQKHLQFFPTRKQISLIYGEQKFLVSINDVGRIVSKKLFDNTPLVEGSVIRFKIISNDKFEIQIR